MRRCSGRLKKKSGEGLLYDDSVIHRQYTGGMGSKDTKDTAGQVALSLGAIRSSSYRQNASRKQWQSGLRSIGGCMVTINWKGCVLHRMRTHTLQHGGCENASIRLTKIINSTPSIRIWFSQSQSAKKICYIAHALAYCTVIGLPPKLSLFSVLYRPLRN